MVGRYLLIQATLLILVVSAYAQIPRHFPAAPKLGDVSQQQPIKRPRIKVTKQPAIVDHPQPVPVPRPTPTSFFPAPTPTVAHVEIPEPQIIVQKPISRPEPERHTSQPESRRQAEEELLRKQAENAHYSFGTSVKDGIMDHQLFRQETRDGLKLSGTYSSSDGFYRHTVQYEADENGYRIVKDTSEPIGEGPQLNLDGHAEVETNISGLQNKYSITAEDIKDLNPHKQ